MKKLDLPGMTKKESLQARSLNRVYHFLLADGQIRGAMFHGTHTIQEMRVSHELGILETLVLGHAYLGIALMASGLKGQDAIALKIECSGPIKGLTVEANAQGEVRGHLKINPIPLNAPMESWDLSPLFGTGFLIITRFPQNARQPYIGQVKLKYGNIASDLANYYALSEEIPTVFNLSVKFAPDGSVLGAGGLLLQPLPGAEEALIAQLENIVNLLPSIGEALARHQSVEDFIHLNFAPMSPKILDNYRVEFFCPCRKETIRDVLSRFQPETIDDMLQSDTFPIEIRCHNCNTIYTFEKEEIQEILDHIRDAAASEGEKREETQYENT